MAASWQQNLAVLVGHRRQGMAWIGSAAVCRAPGELARWAVLLPSSRQCRVGSRGPRGAMHEGSRQSANSCTAPRPRRRPSRPSHPPPPSSRPGSKASLQLSQHSALTSMPRNVSNVTSQVSASNSRAAAKRPSRRLVPRRGLDQVPDAAARRPPRSRPSQRASAGGRPDATAASRRSWTWPAARPLHGTGRGQTFPVTALCRLRC